MSKHDLIHNPNRKRTSADLLRLQQLPLLQKIELTKSRISQYHDYYNGLVYGSWSGGTDSTVMMDIIWQDYPRVPAVFSNTGLEYPEIVKFVKEIQQSKPITIIVPDFTFKQVIDEFGWPVVSKEQSQFIYEARTSQSEKLRNTRLNGNDWGRGKIYKKISLST